jgi:hypothetical protein
MNWQSVAALNGSAGGRRSRSAMHKVSRMKPIKAGEIVDHDSEENLTQQFAKQLGNAGPESIFDWLAQARS